MDNDNKVNPNFVHNFFQVISLMNALQSMKFFTRPVVGQTLLGPMLNTSLLLLVASSRCLFC